MSAYKMFFAGSGGQGILLMGQMITKAAMIEDKNATFLPSYGPEMRGGTANCTVIVSDKDICCPLIYEADIVIAMNTPSMISFEGLVRSGGKLFLNSSLTEHEPTRTDIEVIRVPANDLALELGNSRTANMIMLGAVVRNSGVVGMEAINHVLAEVFTGKKAKLLPLNQQALLMFNK